MTATDPSSQPRTLTDAVRARQARQRGRSPVAGSGSSTRTRTARPEVTAASAAGRPPGKRHGERASALSRLLSLLKRMGRKLWEAREALLGDRALSLRKLGMMVALGLLARRLPGPLRALERLLMSGEGGERGFGFWWWAVTLGVALAVGALVAVLLTPVAGLIALVAVGIWMLVRRRRAERAEKAENDGPDRGSQSRGAEGDLADQALSA